MLNTILSNLYEKDLRVLIEEVKQFKVEDNLWQTTGSVKNSAGNLALHIIGGLNHFFGATLANTGYIRTRDQEFSKKGVKREDLITGLEEVIGIVTNTLNNLTQKELEAEYPLIFDGEKKTTMFIVVRMYAHLSYHLGQINYLRRILE
ncbi:MAG TPA: DUF1572 family protein [Puia sp.]|jgi:hypothetical protein|nr:DUF1572 family protein [Puia sp.]